MLCLLRGILKGWPNSQNLKFTKGGGSVAEKDNSDDDNVDNNNNGNGSLSRAQMNRKGWFSRLNWCLKL